MPDLTLKTGCLPTPSSMKGVISRDKLSDIYAVHSM